MPHWLTAVPIAAAALAMACSGSGAPPAPTTQPPPLPVTAETTRPPVPTTTIAPAGTLPAAGTSTIPETTRCPVVTSQFTGAVFDPALTEISGMAASRSQPGVLWIHNDSGDEPVVYAVAADGTVLGSHRLAGADAVDWEDIAIGPGSDSDDLYVGDIGDNTGSRDHVVVYRVAEPSEAATGPRPVRLDGVSRFALHYPEEPYDAETLLVDPATGDVYIVTKDVFGASLVFRAAAPLVDGAVLEEVAVLELGIGGLATAGDVSPSGDLVALRTYTAVLVWGRSPGDDVATALGGEPCLYPVLNEGQGEALSFAPGGDALYTVPEGAGASIQHHDLGD